MGKLQRYGQVTVLTINKKKAWQKKDTSLAGYYQRFGWNLAWSCQEYKNKGIQEEKKIGFISLDLTFVFPYCYPKFYEYKQGLFYAFCVSYLLGPFLT